MESEITSPSTRELVDGHGELAKVAWRCTIKGLHTVPKYRDEVCNTVRVCLGILRIPAHNADICITVNVPVSLHPDSSTSGCRLSTAESADFILSKVLESLRINDYDLFE